MNALKTVLCGEQQITACFVGLLFLTWLNFGGWGC